MSSLTDKEYYQLTISIGKAVSMIESPVKEKHIRAAIIGTYHCRGSSAFWTVMLKQPLQEHRIVAWKFCYVLHKVLREGYHMCLPQSVRHKSTLSDVGKLWGHLQEGYGKLILLYCNLMLTKLDFHQRNPHIPGNLIMTSEELEKIYGDDINNYFQLSVEMFDYIDDILALQESIINSLKKVAITSMTSTGQCRLAPLIPCIQDSNQLYDFVVKLLFKLHGKLQPDTLSGHRERFQKQFVKLKDFYNKARDYEYFSNLISIPRLPKRPPNFLEQSDLRTYVAPVVVVAQPEPEPEEVREEPIREEILLDVSAEPTPAQQTNDLHDLIRERNALIHELQQEIARLNVQINQLMADNRARNEAMQNQFEQLQIRLLKAEQELELEQRAKKEMEDIVAVSQKEVSIKTEELEKKSSMQEEKFQRLKELYTNIRDEHVNLLRQKADVDKQLAVMVKEKAQLEEGQKLAENKNQKSSADLSVKYEALLKEMAELKTSHSDVKTQHFLEVQELRKQCEETREEKMTLVEKVDCLNTEKKIVEDEVTALVTQRDELDMKLKESIAICERIKECVENEQRQRTSLVTRLNAALLHSAADNVRRALHELDEPAASGTTCSPDYFRKTADEACTHLEKLGQTALPLAAVNDQGEVSLESCRDIITCGQLLSSVITQGKGTSNTSTNIELGERLQENVRAWGTILAFTLDQIAADPSATSKTEFYTPFQQNVQLSPSAANASTSSSGEGDVSRGFLANSNNEQNGMSSRNSRTSTLEDLVKQLRVLIELAGGLMVSDIGLDALGDQVEDEMAGMDKAIEEAAKKIEGLLSASRTADSGIKLEVNEKILDACTSLMAAIRELVQTSRSVQAEIVAEGKGTATAKEFYKRNHQWTEGLISAAKAVALGAKLLVSAADESLRGSGKFEALMVAAQEIAACSVRLVVASRVKAQRGSVRLQALKHASVGVGQATGAVVAAVKSCTQMVEAAQDLDVSGLNLHQAKKLEMESQVRLIELEQSLAMERLRLAALRRQHYQLSGE